MNKDFCKTVFEIRNSEGKTEAIFSTRKLAEELIQYDDPDHEFYIIETPIDYYTLDNFIKSILAIPKNLADKQMTAEAEN
jgi:hypothetical protein